MRASITMNEKIVEIAREWLGTPYRHQMSVKGLGCDCLGLLRGVWRTYYQSDEPEQAPNYSPSWGDHRGDDPLMGVAKKYFDSVSCLEVGDVLMFRMRPTMAVKHCAILTGPETMIHAYSRHEVREEDFSDWWQKKLVGRFRFR